MRTDKIYRLLLHNLLAVEQPPDDGEDDDAANDGVPAIADKRNTDQCKSQEGRDVLQFLVASDIALVDSPKGRSHQQSNVDDQSRVERQTQNIDEEQLKPAAHSDNARDDAVENGSYQHKRHQEGDQRTLQLDVGETSIAVDQHDGRQTQQVEQVYANAQTCHIENEYQPTVGMRLIGMIFPFQYQPKHDSGERRRVGINLTFHSGEPECVTPCVDQSAHNTTGLNGDGLAQRQ